MSFVFCPCEGCIYYTAGKTWPNPNAYDPHYCELCRRAIYKTAPDHVVHPNVWVIPCHGELYVEREDVPDGSTIIGYSRKDGILLDR